MKIREESFNKEATFGNLKTGDGFVYNCSHYIKISKEVAFSLEYDCTVSFLKDTIVEKREVEVVFK